jgi:hypothetical protein
MNGIGIPGIYQRGHSDAPRYIREGWHDQALFPAGDKRRRVICAQALLHPGCKPLTVRLHHFCSPAPKDVDKRIVFAGLGRECRTGSGSTPDDEPGNSLLARTSLSPAQSHHPASNPRTELS